MPACWGRPPGCLPPCPLAAAARAPPPSRRLPLLSRLPTACPCPLPLAGPLHYLANESCKNATVILIFSGEFILRRVCRQQC